ALEEAPDILTVEEVADYLRIARRRAYDLVRREGLRLKLGRRVRIPKDRFKKWLKEKDEGEVEREETAEAEATTAPHSTA
ncbi:MAG: helix-turn-helix domain-containing protein, partial [bacterium]